MQHNKTENYWKITSLKGLGNFEKTFLRLVIFFGILLEYFLKESDLIKKKSCFSDKIWENLNIIFHRY